MASARTKPRNCWNQLLLFDGDNNAEGKCWYFEEKKAEWKEFTTSQCRTGATLKTCVSGNDIILTGGIMVLTLMLCGLSVYLKRSGEHCPQ